MTNIIGILPNQCFGCGACVSVCPEKCIAIDIGDNGFYNPIDLNNNCKNCMQCRNVCPVNNPLILNSNTKNVKYYGCINIDDNTRFNSSSGGLFSALSKYIIQNYGVVYGAAYDYKNIRVLHKRIDSLNDITLLQKSKYVQSYTGDIYCRVKNDLSSGKNVLFSGTPCQINGLKNYLKFDYSNLYTIDLICHGVPSPELFHDHFAILSKNKSISHIDFRTKIKGWNGWTKKYIEYTIDNKKYKKHAFLDAYYTMWTIVNKSDTKMRKSARQ